MTKDVGYHHAPSAVSTVVIPTLVSFALAFALTPLFRALAIRAGRLDLPTHRSSHTVPTPRNGGYAIVLGIAGAFAVLARVLDRQLLILGLAALAAAILAWADERFTVRPLLRLVLQIAIAAVAVTAGGLVLTRIAGVPLLWLAVPVTLFWLVGVLNGFNFMDGINGIASVEAMVCGVALAALLARQGDTATAAIAFGVAAAAAGFLPWNLPSGSIFMGDTGSTALGLSLALLVVRAAAGDASFVAAALPLLPFLLDTSLTILHRARRREHLFEAHRSHYYQRLNQLGYSHALVTSVWGALAVACATAALVYDALPVGGQVVAVGAVGALHALLFVWIDRSGKKA
jgi:UDP-N-acetylmuramyl pentapeptide phosphotransferase/UDP-N-acetylglucosamine-1-phosphate transferase